MNYSPDARIEDRLGPLEPPYRSRGEAQVGRILDRHKIPFFYEQPTLIYDRGRHYILRPDFTLPTYNGLIIEYAGMPDVPHYRARNRRRQRTYAINGVPAVFVYPKDLSGPDWPARLYGRIERAGERAIGHVPAPRAEDPEAPYR